MLRQKYLFSVQIRENYVPDEPDEPTPGEDDSQDPSTDEPTDTNDPSTDEPGADDNNTPTDDITDPSLSSLGIWKWFITWNRLH